MANKFVSSDHPGAGVVPTNASVTTDSNGDGTSSAHTAQVARLNTDDTVEVPCVAAEPAWFSNVSAVHGSDSDARRPIRVYIERIMKAAGEAKDQVAALDVDGTTSGTAKAGRRSEIALQVVRQLDLAVDLLVAPRRDQAKLAAELDLLLSDGAGSERLRAEIRTRLFRAGSVDPIRLAAIYAEAISRGAWPVVRAIEETNEFFWFMFPAAQIGDNGLKAVCDARRRQVDVARADRLAKLNEALADAAKTAAMARHLVSELAPKALSHS